MPTCSVKYCGNGDYKNKKDGTSVKFFRPPLSTSVGRSWILPHHLKLSQNDIRVCSEHFISTDFISNSNGKILKPEAVPTQKLPLEATHTLTFNKSFMSDGGETQLVAGDIVINVCFDKKAQGVGIMFTDVRGTSSDTTAAVNAYTEKIESQLGRKLKKLRQRLAIAQNNLKIRKQTRIEALRKVHQEQKRCLHSRNAYLGRRNEDLRLKLNQAQAIMQKCFSPTQLQVLHQGRPGTHWSEEDICKAIVLKARSPSAYELVRTAWKIPLPGLSTLRRWTSKIDFENGILKPVMSLMTQEFKSASKFRRQCVLSFDEMAVDGVICYDMKNDRIIGPHSNLMVMFARGLFEKWKQPIFADFDFTFTKESMQSIFNALNNANLEARAVVSDLGPNNRRVKKDFQISHDMTYFTCSTTGNKVWLFYDLPHLIKRLRDNILDYTITLADGTQFSRADFELVLN